MENSEYLKSVIGKTAVEETLLYWNVVLHLASIYQLKSVLFNQKFKYVYLLCYGTIVLFIIYILTWKGVLLHSPSSS